MSDSHFYQKRNKNSKLATKSKRYGKKPKPLNIIDQIIDKTRLKRQ